MIVTQVPQPVYPQPTPAPPPQSPEPAANAAEPTAKGGGRGIALLSGEAAAVVIAQQAEPAATPTGLDLSGRDLRGEDLSNLDLRGANLTGVDLTGKDLSGLDLSGATLTSARLNDANLTNTKLAGVTAKGADFSGATVVRTNVDGADLSNTKFKGALISMWEGGNESPRDFVESEANSYFFRPVDASNADFSGASIKYVGFRQTKLDNAKFDGADLRFGIADSSAKGASFQGMKGEIQIGGSDISESKFTNVNGARINIGQSKVDKASFAGSANMTLGLADLDLRTVDLSLKDKSFRNSYFANNIMTGMDFSGADFTGACFMTYGRQAESSFLKGKAGDLTDAVAGANFKGATFTGASFYNFDMRKALVDAGALDGAKQHVNWAEGRYSQYRDLFKNAQSSIDAARIMYSNPMTA